MEAYNVVMDEPKRGKGRPKRLVFSKMMSIRFTPKQVEWIQRMAEEDQCQEAEAVRRAVTAAARLRRYNGSQSEHTEEQ